MGKTQREQSWLYLSQGDSFLAVLRPFFHQFFLPDYQLYMSLLVFLLNQELSLAPRFLPQHGPGMLVSGEL